MKKTTLSPLLALFCFVNAFYAQPVITIKAPAENYPAQPILPSGPTAHNYQRGSFLITANELSSLLSTNITDFGFSFDRGTGNAPVSGNLVIYLQNTNDITYNKGTNYNAAILGMISVYSGGMSIPAATSPSTVMFNILGGFNYTGGGLYVAYDWVTTSTSSPSYAYYHCNRSSTSITGGYRSSSVNSPATMATLLSSQYRPVCVIQADNNATNEAGVINVDVAGKVAEAMHANQIITAEIKNASLNSLNNIPVTLNISGANTFSDIQTVGSLAAGAVATVTFSPFLAVALGTNNVAVTIPNDENPANDQFYWDQDVTCNVASNCPPAITYSTSFGNATFGTLCLSRFNFEENCTLRMVDIAIGYDWSTVNAKLYGVVLDNAGTIVATTNTINAVNTIFNTVQTFTFTADKPLTKKTNYYIGMAQTKGYFMGATEQPTHPDKFYSAPIGGGVPVHFADAYFGIDPIISGLDIKITQTNTVVCSGGSMILKATGASNYTWTASVFNPVGDPNSANVSVSPNANEIYTVTATDDAGCGSTKTTFLKVISCVGLAENQSMTDLKVYPNPSNGKAFIAGLSGTNTIVVYNILGEAVVTMQSDEETQEIDLGDQPAGNYLVKITDAGNSFKTVKLINQK